MRLVEREQRASSNLLSLRTVQHWQVWYLIKLDFLQKLQNTSFITRQRTGAVPEIVENYSKVLRVSVDENPALQQPVEVSRRVARYARYLLRAEETASSLVALSTPTCSSVRFLRLLQNIRASIDRGSCERESDLRRSQVDNRS